MDKDKPASKRELVEAEIITSERNYSRDVNIFLDVFIRPLRRHAVNNPRTACLTDVEASVLECSLEKVLACSKELLRRLEEEQQASQQASQSTNAQPRTMARVFLDESERIRRAYVDFVSGYRAALDLHSDLLDRKKRKGASCSYHSFIKNCADANDLFVGGRIFTDFMILPIQRIPRYRLLLESLLRRVPSRYERAYIKEAIKRVSIIADEMNYRLRKTISTKTTVRRVPSSASTRGEDEDEAPLGTIEEETEQETEEEEEIIPEVLGAGDSTTEELGSESEASEGTEQELQQEGMLTPTSQYRREHAKELLVESWLDKNLWKGENLISAPTSNSFALYALAVKGNPWKASELSHMHAVALSAKLLELYSQIKSPPPDFKPARGDIVVVGPIRSGQTPVLQALKNYSLGTFFRSPHCILNHVGYLGWDDWPSTPSAAFRLLKSHTMDLKTVFTGGIAPALKSTRPEWHVVVTLRNPADLRLSFFRHVRRMFRKMNPEFNFDRMAVLDELASSLAEYESFIADVLKVVVDHQSPQILIVFYEEMIADPTRVAERIAEFVEFIPEEVQNKSLPKEEIIKARADFTSKVVLGITTSPFFVGYSSRVGSVGQGRNAFSRQSMQKMDAEWDARIKAKWNQFSSYEKLFCAITGREAYPSHGNGAADGDKRGSMRKSRSFTLFQRSRAAGESVSRENSYEDQSSWHASGIPAAPATPRGSMSLLSRLTKAFSFSSTASSEHEGSSSTLLIEHGTSRNKDIDPDDSDEEIPDDLLNFWNQGESD